MSNNFGHREVYGIEDTAYERLMDKVVDDLRRPSHALLQCAILRNDIALLERNAEQVRLLFHAKPLIDYDIVELLGLIDKKLQQKQTKLDRYIKLLDKRA